MIVSNAKRGHGWSVVEIWIVQIGGWVCRGDIHRTVVGYLRSAIEDSQTLRRSAGHKRAEYRGDKKRSEQLYAVHSLSMPIVPSARMSWCVSRAQKHFSPNPLLGSEEDYSMMSASTG